MKLKSAIVSVLAICATIAISVSSAPTSEDEIGAGTSPGKAVHTGFSPAKLIDFKNYKTIFHKTYSRMLEELVRNKYFLSRAFRTFVSAIRYRYRKSPFYLALNEMSDWTSEEIEKSKNKILFNTNKARMIEAAKEFKNDEPVRVDLEKDLREFVPEDVHEVEMELRRIAESKTVALTGFDEPKRCSGDSSKSSHVGSQAGQVRDLPIEKLIDTGADAQLSPEAARKETKIVPSNNPRYKPPEFMSYGLRDEPINVRFWAIKSKGQSIPLSDFTNALDDSIGGPCIIGPDKQNAADQLPDEVLVDLRDSDCFTLPRQQGRCGSCWAFASTAIFEYLYCKKTGKLVAFSEQYMIDCGKAYISRSAGCNGGTGKMAANFVKNFGLELRVRYPYNMRENECPYEESTYLNRTGYIRFDFTNTVMIDLDLWPDYIQKWPVYTGISISPDFLEYGGGVFGWGCGQETEHAVVVVGHGRKDGHEYWLIRNSYSVGWGEGGYGKLAKKAACADRTGFIFATSDGRAVRPGIKNNELNDRSLVKKRYMKTML